MQFIELTDTWSQLLSMCAVKGDMEKPLSLWIQGTTGNESIGGTANELCSADLLLKSLTEQELNTFVICANYTIGTALHNFVWKNIYLIDTMDSVGLPINYPLLDTKKILIGAIYVFQRDLTEKQWNSQSLSNMPLISWCWTMTSISWTETVAISQRWPSNLSNFLFERQN